MLANSLARQNFGSIELYFLIYFRMDWSCNAGKIWSEDRQEKWEKPQSRENRCIHLSEPLRAWAQNIQRAHALYHSFMRMSLSWYWPPARVHVSWKDLFLNSIMIERGLSLIVFYCNPTSYTQFLGYEKGVSLNPKCERSHCSKLQLLIGDCSPQP